MYKPSFKIFMDFDGTITTEDVGENIFLKFGERGMVDSIIEDLLADKISSKECWIKLCESVQEINKTELDSFIDQFEIDPGFKNFIRFCNDNKLKYFILSDGFDYYIKRLLQREGVEDIKFFSNRLEVSERKLIPSFPHFDISFPSSANCKRNHIINNSSDDEFTVYVGDGNSDKHTVHYCDFVFAKDGLLKYCEKERISYFPFSNFMNVQEMMMKLIARKRLKKRHQAELKRREAYMQE